MLELGRGMKLISMSFMHTERPEIDIVCGNAGKYDEMTANIADNSQENKNQRIFHYRRSVLLGIG